MKNLFIFSPFSINIFIIRALSTLNKGEQQDAHNFQPSLRICWKAPCESVLLTAYDHPADSSEAHLKDIMVYKRHKKPVSKHTGRPCKLDTLNHEQIRKLACKGWTDEEMADFFEISIDSWYYWKSTRPDFFDSLKSWKDQYDERVQISLAESAIGYQHREDKVFVHQGRTIVVPTIKHYPPNPTSMIFWLKNRQPEQWRDVHKVEHTGKDGGPIETASKPRFVDLSDFTDAELAVIASAGLKLNVKSKEEEDGQEG